MVGLGVGMLTSLGLHALFGNRHHDMEGEVAEQETQAVVEEERQGLDRTDFMAAVGGAGTAMAAATLLKNRHLFSQTTRSSAVAIRTPFQLPRRYMVISILGAIGGLVVNSMRKESNRLSELPPTTYEPTYQQEAYGQPTSKWGDEEVPATTTTV
jgi:hypothetical protein